MSTLTRICTCTGTCDLCTWNITGKYEAFKVQIRLYGFLYSSGINSVALFYTCSNVSTTVFSAMHMHGSIGMGTVTKMHQGLPDAFRHVGLLLEDLQEITCVLSNGTNNNDLEWPLRSLLLSEIFLTPVPHRKCSRLCLQMNWKTNVSCNFSCLIESSKLKDFKQSHTLQVAQLSQRDRATP